MERNLIEVVRDDSVATIVLSRPETHNRLSTSAMAELAATLEQLDSDDGVRVVVVTGQGRAFCAGADIREFEGAGLLAQRRQAGAFQGLCMALHRMSKPVIAKVNGVAMGGGMAMVSLAHLAIASEDARFATPEINVGAFPSMVMTAILRSVPRKRALKMILLGETVGSREALEMGLVSQVVPGDQLDAATAEVARSLAEKSPSVLRLGLDSIRLSADMAYPQAMEYLREMNTLIRNTEDFREGAKAFLDKRAPVFQGN